MNREADVVIVGAGLAGLMAAQEIVRAGREVIALEARDRVGGRVLSQEIAPGVTVDLGGQWLGPTQDHAYSLVKALGLELFPTYQAGEHVVFHQGRLKRYQGAIPNIGLRALLDIGRAQKRLDTMAKQIDLHAPWNATHANLWDSITLEQWADKTMSTYAGKRGVSLFSEAVFAAEPSEFSLLHTLFYIHSGTSFDCLISTHGGAQQDRFTHGAQRMAQGLAATLGDRLCLNAPVRKIEQTNDRAHVHTDSGVYTGKCAIVAIPPTLAGRIDYSPPMPPDRDQLTQCLPHGSVIKCMSLYAEPFWRERGLSGMATSDTGPVRLIYDNSPANGTPGILLSFLEGEAARTCGRMSQEERRQAVIDCSVRYLGEQARKVEDYFELNWSAEPWTRGCYGAHFPTGVWTQFGHALRAPVGRIHWAGTETATRWMGYMEGALESGIRAAQEVLEIMA